MSSTPEPKPLSPAHVAAWLCPRRCHSSGKGHSQGLLLSKTLPSSLSSKCSWPQLPSRVLSLAGARRMQGWLSPGLAPAAVHSCASADRAVEQRCQEAAGRARARCAAAEAAWDTSGEQPQPAQGSRAALHSSAQLRRLCAFNLLVATFLSGPSQSLLPRHVGTSLLGLMMQHQVFSSIPAITTAFSFRNPDFT